jgi:putative aminopeptidase FrvX
MKRIFRVVVGTCLLLVPPRAAGQVAANLSRFGNFPAVSGHEELLAKDIQFELRDFSPRMDNLGNVILTIGSGAPHRLIVTAIDEPGYVVSEITQDGFLRVQRLPQTPPNAVFDTLHFGQPVSVRTREGKWISGVFSGLSVHLQPGRQGAPKMSHLDEMYIDIGARTAEEVRSAGVDVLDMVALGTQISSVELGTSEVAGVRLGDRFGAAALRELAGKLSKAKPMGTTTIAFVTQGWTGGRGLDRLLQEVHPDEMIYLGRILEKPAADSTSGARNLRLGGGVLLAVKDASVPLSGFTSEIQQIAAKKGMPITVTTGAPPRITGYVAPNVFPERFAQLGVATLWPVTPVEALSLKDIGSLEQLLEAYLGISEPLLSSYPGGVPGCEKIPVVLPTLVEAYGASGHESGIRDEVNKLLPEWARKKTETDAAGNLILHLGAAKPDANTPRTIFVAHMDEIGYQVRSIEADGRLAVDVLGGGYTEYFLGHPVLFHQADRKTIGGVLELPTGWDKPGFEWTHGPRGIEEPAHVYVGTHSSEETQKLGIKVGDWLTIPKEYRPLLGTRANGRSFDDRVGCAALIEAVRALGPNLPGRDVTFVWSTEEEVGLKGAAAYAERAAKEGKTPDFVFAIDTFVSSDSPLESKRFGDAELGKGFVIRAVDNSNITPREYVDRVVKLARENSIPVQYGVTGGGNDGSVFTRYGSVDIPLGWPLRYSHSPGEVIDTRDLDALAKIVVVLAKSW